MTFQEEITSKFIAEDQIPAAYALPEQIDQKEYLVNGEMRQWNGDLHTVYSPVCVVTPEGLQRKVIGRYPRLHRNRSHGSIGCRRSCL